MDVVWHCYICVFFVMARSRITLFHVSACAVILLALAPGQTHGRVDELEQAAQKYREVPKQQPVPTESPEPPKTEPKPSKCFHMDRSACPVGPLRCARVDAASVFCCDVDNFRLKEGLAASMTQNTTNLHVLNATIQELDVSQAVFRRLASMAVTDGNIGKIVVIIKMQVNQKTFLLNLTYRSQFPKYSSIACLNISNNNLTSEKLQPSIARPFAYLFNLSILDASANNLTEFPLSLVHSNRKISVDLSGNNYLLCKYYQNAMDTNNGSLLTVLNYNKTFCAVDLTYQWFKEMLIVPVDHVRIQKELNESCQHIKPANINCTCHNQRLILLAGEPTTNAVYVDCSNRGLKEMPTNLPPNTRGLNVSFNNITSLQAVSDDPTYEDVRRLIADHNDVADILELEGSQFIDHFSLLNISYNKLKTIHTYVWPAKSFDTSIYLGGNYIHCDCNTEKVFKPWLAEHYKIIPDFKEIQCADNMGAVVDLKEYQVCHSPRDWTDYIYYIIALEVLTLVLLISKVSYDYWVFKTAGYLPWPANKMPRLPCDWLCE